MVNRSHNPKVEGSNPSPATSNTNGLRFQHFFNHSISAQFLLTNMTKRRYRRNPFRPEEDDERRDAKTFFFYP